MCFSSRVGNDSVLGKLIMATPAAGWYRAADRKALGGQGDQEFAHLHCNRSHPYALALRLQFARERSFG